MTTIYSGILLPVEKWFQNICSRNVFLKKLVLWHCLPPPSSRPNNCMFTNVWHFRHCIEPSQGPRVKQTALQDSGPFAQSALNVLLHLNFLDRHFSVQITVRSLLNPALYVCISSSPWPGSHLSFAIHELFHYSSKQQLHCRPFSDLLICALLAPSSHLHLARNTRCCINSFSSWTVAEFY